MWIYLASFVGIFLENSFFFSGEKVFFVSIPFFSYVLLKQRGGSILPLLITVIFVSLQGNSYFSFFLYFLCYGLIFYLLFRNMEYNQGTVFYLSMIELIFYSILQNYHWNLFYFVIHGVCFLVLNYYYLKKCY
ncbi:hypothetical protein A2U10_08730 [Fusobacterium necrophorum subsp. funduliforme]|uniref:Uncharacterized protein n=5 Tax=Fusobacterium necrophorum TaxID=859 RepID=A0AAN3VXS3_9FUSO|nr:hypothetical protein [Fusobacterium necrophorum]KDE66395.1 hypothetical protein FUSO5_02515 [Fusobacterium necrophorum BFTR-1]KDE74885.1 hypothetical protein FUSO7_00485 [Fusobacterium necrophorum BFTR-2]AVQ20212.1 hypothetical protein C4N15_00385 [Fusobacterium necrophorum subsp. funduliforme]AYV93751.1 hypothetical protein BSQ88_08750 [Fusobacterium necrophorum subsp. funduliforme]AYV95917.1 hypothetical protein BWX37_09920 [Fusobacterium necrophorum subsp. funduliforme]